MAIAPAAVQPAFAHTPHQCVSTSMPSLMQQNLVHTDLTEEDVKPLKSKMADNLFHQVPVGVGGKSELK